LGTAFNINAYSDEGAVKTTLAEGAVKVEHERKDLVLQAGHQTVWDRTSGAFFEQKADVEQATAWKDGRFEFDHTDLGTILRQLARWYDVDIRYAAKAGEGEYGGNISRQLNLDETLKLLESNDTSLRFRVEAKTVVVERKEVERK
jgi:ferric-dicitrate binding protein FerR (iron transport regulator)